MSTPVTSSRYLYTGYRRGHMQAAPPLGTVRFGPPRLLEPEGFPVSISPTEPFDASAVVHTRSSSRYTANSLVASLFRSRFPLQLLTEMTLRCFGISACSANAEGLPPSLTQHESTQQPSTLLCLFFQDTPLGQLLEHRYVQGQVGDDGL